MFLSTNPSGFPNSFVLFTTIILATSLEVSSTSIFPSTKRKSNKIKIEFDSESYFILKRKDHISFVRSLNREFKYNLETLTCPLSNGSELGPKFILSASQLPWRFARLLVLQNNHLFDFATESPFPRKHLIAVSSLLFLVAKF